MAITKIIFDKNWKKVIRGQSIARWNLIAEHDLVRVDKAEVKYDRFATMLQVKYGYTRQRACEEINRFWVEHEIKMRVTQKMLSRQTDGGKPSMPKSTAS
jgi:hypothetical protein